jgi:hypothetical protein
MDYGKLIATKKGKKYIGKSNITHKALYHVLYGLYFYKENEKIIGYLASDKPFTFSKAFSKKSEAQKFLEDNDYTVEQWEVI